MSATVPKKAKGVPDQSVKLPGDVVQMARTIVSVKGGAMADLIADHVRPILRRMLEQMQERGEFFPLQKTRDQ